MRYAYISLLTLIASPAAAEVQFERQYIDGSYGQVHVLISEPETSSTLHTPVACLSPNPMAGRYYRLFMQQLGQDRVMIAPDYPGLGQSDPPPGMLDMAGYADSMAETLDALGYGKNGSGAIDICGYHTGTFVAIELALRRPDLVRKLLLLGIPFYEGEARQEMYDNNVVAAMPSDKLESLQGSWEFTVVDRQDGVALQRGYDNFVDILMQRFRSHWPYHAVFSYAAEPAAASVSQPVVILNTHGGLEEQTRALADYFADATLIEIPQLHHGIFDVGAKLLADEARNQLDH
ncbi:MAG: alpha/beta hydrolase [Gammaproteobacteria bacterium]|nr:alpha/beta hydrolase [Gammaproteobacteria bacterium]